jgi:hypothetical protein
LFCFVSFCFVLFCFVLFVCLICLFVVSYKHVGLAKLLALLGRKEKVEDIVHSLLPHRSDVLSDEEWVRSDIANRLINRETVKPLLL